MDTNSRKERCLYLISAEAGLCYSMCSVHSLNQESTRKERNNQVTR